MPFYLRKSLKVGPFRFNLSGSGIGMSVGAEGFRFGTGPHGHYIYAGRGGFYYKTWMRKQPSKSTALIPRFQSPNLQPIPGVGPFIPVECGNIEQMIDADAESILKQINQNLSAIPVWPFPAAIAALCLLISISASSPADYICGAAGVFGLLFALILYRWDELRRTTVLMYDLEDAAIKVFEVFIKEFESVSKAQKALNIQAAGEVYDWKRHAGAHLEMKATPARFGFGVPKRIHTNVSVPFISGGLNTVYFFPDLLIVQQKVGLGGVDYRQLGVRFGDERWIEHEWVPNDATVIGYTWRFARRDGGPDRRFNNNRQLPILAYQSLALSGPGNFQKLIYLSKRADRSEFLKTIAGLAYLHGSRVVPSKRGASEDTRALPAS